MKGPIFSLSKNSIQPEKTTYFSLLILQKCPLCPATYYAFLDLWKAEKKKKNAITRSLSLSLNIVATLPKVPGISSFCDITKGSFPERCIQVQTIFHAMLISSFQQENILQDSMEAPI